MRYSTEPKHRKYFKGCGFLSFAKKYGKKLIDSATKTGVGAAKTASKRVVQKTAEKIGDLINLVGKSTGKTKKVEEIHIPPEKKNKSLIA